jgi:hypothetical protein
MCDPDFGAAGRKWPENSASLLDFCSLEAVFRPPETLRPQRGLAVAVAELSRAGFYRFQKPPETAPDKDMDLHDAIQRIALEWPSYGRPRITAQLQRQAQAVDGKAFFESCGLDNYEVRHWQGWYRHIALHPSGEDGINSMPCAATIESAVRFRPLSIYYCCTNAGGFLREDAGPKHRHPASRASGRRCRCRR